MLRYPCLVLDHDDTVVQSEATVNYPFFCQVLERFRPGERMTLHEYTRGCFTYGFAGMCRRRFGFTDGELAEEYRAWRAYAAAHMAPAYPGIQAVIRRQKAGGGLVCVVSHSGEENILRDYRDHFGVRPDAVYSWDLPPEQRKPNPYPLEDIMARFGLAAGELLVVDDLLQGWEMASRAGVKIAFAAWSHLDLPEILTQMRSVCDFSFDTPGELEQFLFD